MMRKHDPARYRLGRATLRRRVAILVLLVSVTMGATWSPTDRVGGKIAAPIRPVDVMAAPPQADLVQEIVVGGLSFPTAMAFLPDGRLLIAEKAGRVRVFKGGALLPTPFIDISAHVNNYEDRGLLGIAVDPDFAVNHRVYLLYTYEHQPTDAAGPKTARLTWVTADGDVASGAETPILGTLVAGMQVPDVNPVKIAQSCSDFGPNADCLFSDGIIHSIGSVKAAPDGTLFVTIGDATINGSPDNPFRAQDLDTLSGKVLHIDRDGNGVAGNPFFTGGVQLTDNRAKVWALGMRNPFRLNLRPGSDPPVPYLGDVGWDSAEEINVATAGANLGWPCYEGASPQTTFGTDPRCQGQTFKNPLVAYTHSDPNGQLIGSAVVGGTFYTGTTFPAPYRPGPGEGVYIYGDYARNIINYLKVDANNAVIQAPQPIFVDDVGAPVAFEMNAADGNIYFLAIATGQLRRIRPYDPAIPTCQTGEYRAEYFNNSSLAGSPTFQRCEASVIDYYWADGSPDPRINADAFAVRWTGRFVFTSGLYRFTGNADDGIRVFVDGVQVWNGWPSQLNEFTVDRAMPGGEHEIKVEYTEQTEGALAKLLWAKIADNEPPTATITSPPVDSTYKVGDLISFTGQAADPEDETLADAQLAWSVILQHCPGGPTNCHQHPTLSVNGRSGSFRVDDHGDDTYYQLLLTATDSGGQTSAPVSLLLQPRKSPITLETNPPGLQLTYNSTTTATPFVRNAVVGGERIVIAPSSQVVGGVTYDFDRWSDGGTANHTITVGESPLSLTATFKPRTAPSPTPSASPSATPIPTPSASPSASPAPRVALTILPAPGGTATASSGGPYTPGQTIILSAAPAQGSLFLGWHISGQAGVAIGTAPPVISVANPFTLSLNQDTVIAPVFRAQTTFSDLPAGDPAAQAIAQLAARGIIQGYQDGSFGPDDITLRAQMAALITRTMGWDAEVGENNFPDREGVDDNLWRNVGAIATRGIAKGYEDGTYRPLEPVLHIQVISFITRAMVAAGYWDIQPVDERAYPNVTIASGHRQDLSTFIHYAGAIPDRPKERSWDEWATPASRSWFARVLWQVVAIYLGNGQAEGGVSTP